MEKYLAHQNLSSKEPDTMRVRWGVERRLAFIDFRLYWEDRINRSDLTRFFGISVPQASADFRQYQALAPGNIGYDKSGKYYYATDTFRPLFISLDAVSYLNELLSIELGLASRDTTFIGTVPDFTVVPYPQRWIEPVTLYRVLHAIRNNGSLEISYQSFNALEPAWRRISPHALGFDGFRWHIRAYCHRRKAFRDFVFARVLELRDEQPSAVDPLKDGQWNTIVTVKIGPNPALSESQRCVIELDYGMRNGVAEINVRVALLFYLLKQLGLTKTSQEASPTTQHIVLLNLDELEEYLSSSSEGDAAFSEHNR